MIPLPPHRLWIAAAVTLGFTALARAIRGVTRSGAAAGAVVCFLLYAGAGPGAFVGLVAVFVLAWTSTQWGYSRKHALGTAERRDGRTAMQVLANLGVAAGCSVAYAITGGKMAFLLALVAALSEAAADTVSSEIGQAAGSEPRLITTFRKVRAGTNGGVSVAGTLAGAIAAVLVGAVCTLSGLLAPRWLWATASAAVAGMIADSLLGATVERPGWLENNAVNFLSTLMAALLAWSLVR